MKGKVLGLAYQNKQKYPWGDLQISWSLDILVDKVDLAIGLNEGGSSISLSGGGGICGGRISVCDGGGGIWLSVLSGAGSILMDAEWRLSKGYKCS